MSMTQDKIQEAYLEVLTKNDPTAYTQEGADFVYNEIKKTLDIPDGIFEVVNLSETSRGIRDRRDLEFIVK